jgi:hypothetical protein
VKGELSEEKESFLSFSVFSSGKNKSDLIVWIVYEEKDVTGVFITDLVFVWPA